MDIHPSSTIPGPPHLFDGLRLYTSAAFETVNGFVRAYARREKPAGFMRTLMQQRLFSSHVAAIATAKDLIGGGELDDEVQEALEHPIRS